MCVCVCVCVCTYIYIFFLAHQTSDFKSTYGKLNLLFKNSIYLVLSSRKMQRKLIQTKVYCKFFYSV